jgi:hypothetical protein
MGAVFRPKYMVKSSVNTSVSVSASVLNIRKAIENLERYVMIHARKDKPNSQIYKLYINEDSIFLTLYRELENFKNAFFILIDRIITKFIKDNETLQTSISEDSDLLYDLLLIYHHILGIYLIYSMLKWSTELNDESILTKIYAIIIYRMVEIQQKLSEAFRIKGRMPSFDRATVGDVFNPILQEFIHRMFLLEPSAIIKILDDYKKYNLDYEVLPLVAIAWEIGFPIYPYTDLSIELLPEDRNKLKDWRHAVAYYLFKNKNKIQVSDEIWNMLGSPPKSD